MGELANSTSDIRRQLLASHFLISTMPVNVIDDLLNFTTTKRVAADQVIIAEGDVGDCL